MKNWKTTLAGILLAIGLGLQQAPSTVPFQGPIQLAFQVFGAALLGTNAKDKNVTGGTVQQ